MDTGKRGMNPVSMTTINPRTEYWLSRGSNQRPPVFRSYMLPTDPCGLGLNTFGGGGEEEENSFASISHKVLWF